MHALPPFSVAIDNLTVIKGLCRGEQYCTVPRRPHADLWRRIWFKLRDLGAVGVMRVFFSAEGYEFEPEVHPCDFIKTKSHQIEANVPTPQLDHFWVNGEADVHAKKGGLLARVPMPNILHVETVVAELKRAARYVAARLAQLPLHRPEPPPRQMRSKAVRLPPLLAPPPSPPIMLKLRIR